MPRIARLYLTIGLIVTIFLIVVLYLPKNESLVELNEKPPKSLHLISSDDSINRPNEQIIKPLIQKITANDDINSNDNNHRIDPKEWTTSGHRMMGTIDSLSLNIFKESAERHQSDEQKAIVEAMRHSWEAYKTYSWGADHLRPISKTKHNWFSVGLTILDSLDTLIMMGLEEGLTKPIDVI